MRSFIVGTAGHIDHGKSALVEALSGTNPDRLKEEKERGITTDLGFAHLRLSDGVTASFIDVPGHEKFVRQMLAGVHGIDSVLLVVAANEGVMPQTREHLDICRLLGIRRGLIALTKIDTADDPAIARSTEAVRSLVVGTFLEDAPVVPVSARTGAGLDDLRATLLTAAQETPARSTAGLLRLPIDRVFTLRGFGTVLTGTLSGGTLAVGEDVVILPTEKRARVRGLQVHGQSVDTAVAGERTAANLSGVQVEELNRGDVLSRAGSLRPSRVAHVRLETLKGARLRHGERVRVHAGSAEILGRLRLSADEAGHEIAAMAEIRFESAAVLGRGDRLVIRRYSPVQTVAGARVLDPSPRPRRRGELADLARIVEETDELACERFLVEAGSRGLSVAGLAARMAIPPDVAEGILKGLAHAVALAGPEGLFVSSSTISKLESLVLERLRRAHQRDPLARGMSREELRQRVFGRAAHGLVDLVLRGLAERERVRQNADLVALAEHHVSLSPSEEGARAAIERLLRQAGLLGVSLSDLHSSLGLDRKSCENAVRILVQERNAERVGAGLLLSRAALEKFRDDARARFPSGTKLDVGEVKDLTGLSRKYVIPLLEWLDKERVTRRIGAERIVL